LQNCHELGKKIDASDSNIDLDVIPNKSEKHFSDTLSDRVAFKHDTEQENSILDTPMINSSSLPVEVATSYASKYSTRG